MSYFALLNEKNIVVDVLRGRQEDDGKEQELSERTGQTYKQTSFNNRIRKQFAGIGYTYDETADVFIAPQPFPSWTLDAQHDWQPPTPRPEGLGWIWSEENQQWEQA